MKKLEKIQLDFERGAVKMRIGCSLDYVKLYFYKKTFWRKKKKNPPFSSVLITIFINLNEN